MKKNNHKNIVVAGESKTGKSTIIFNLLKHFGALDDRYTNMVCKPETKEVNVYSFESENSAYTIYDTPAIE